MRNCSGPPVVRLRCIGAKLARYGGALWRVKRLGRNLRAIVEGQSRSGSWSSSLEKHFFRCGAIRTSLRTKDARMTKVMGKNCAIFSLSLEMTFYCFRTSIAISKSKRKFLLRGLDGIAGQLKSRPISWQGRRPSSKNSRIEFFLTSNVKPLCLSNCPIHLELATTCWR
ncbi:hypothetical protein D3C86_1558650 [compost metagenome]